MNKEELRQRLEDAIDESLTPTHLNHYLAFSNEEKNEILQNPELQEMLDYARTTCQLKVLDRGFREDSSFSKWYLDRFPIVDQIQTPDIVIRLDTTVSPHLDVFEGK